LENSLFLITEHVMLVTGLCLPATCLLHKTLAGGSRAAQTRRRGIPDEKEENIILKFIQHLASSIQHPASLGLY
jgi:hypothetical protein